MHALGVCSWSLQPASPKALADAVRSTGLRAVQLHLDPIRTGEWSLADTVSLFATEGIRVLSGMMSMEGEDYATLDSIRVTGGVRPDATWEANLQAARANAQLARELSLSLVTFHAGFLPEAPDDPERAVLLSRLRELVDVFAAENVDIAFETGQETAGTLLEVMRDLDRPRAGVNFDPANMLLYDQGDPVEALSLLSNRVHQIHIKDANRTGTPGTWGEEVPVGTGQVNWKAFFDVVRQKQLNVDLVIEREAGDARVRDIQTAASVVKSLVEVDA